MEKRVINALISMGAPMKAKGAKYIVDAMGVYDSCENWTNVKTMALYDEIAKNNKTTLLRVERNIRHVFLGLVTKGNIEAVERYLPEGVAYCCGDVFVGPEIYENSKFSVTDTKTYRAYSRQGARLRKDSVLYRVITAGSIFIPIDKEAFVTSIKKDNLNIIGYNEIIVK